MLSRLISPFRHRIALSFNWRVAEMKSDIEADFHQRIHQMQTQIDQLNMLVADISVSICDQQKIQAVLLDQLHQRVTELEKKDEIRSGVEV